MTNLMWFELNTDTACSLSTVSSHLLPLVDVPDESGQAQQSQQAQDFGKADDTQCPGCPVHFRVQTVHHQENVVHRDRWNEVHQEPALQVVQTDSPKGKGNLYLATWKFQQFSSSIFIGMTGNWTKALPLAAHYRFISYTWISLSSQFKSRGLISIPNRPSIQSSAT